MSSLPPTGQSSSSVVPTAAPTPTQTTMQPAQTTAAAGQMQTTTTTSGVPNQPASSGLANGVAGATWSAPPLSTSPPASSGSATAATAVAAPTAAAAAPGPVTVSGTTGANASGATTTASAPTPSSVFGSYQFDGTTFASSANSSSLPLAEDPRVERVVLAYLKRRGFTQAEEALKQDAKMAQAAAAATTTSASANSVAPTDAAAAASGSESTVDIHTFATEISLDQHTHLLKQILHYSIAESSPDAFASAFDHLKKWMSDCIDVYRSELFCCLWPIYAHIFIQLIHRGFPHDAHRFLARYRSEHEVAHKSELLAFRNLTSDTDLQKCDIVRWFSQRKVEVPMSSFSHHLLVSFLEERNYLLLLKIVNDHLHIKIISRKPLQLEGDMSHSAINAQASGTSSGGAAAGVWNPLNPLAVSHLNTTPIRWGVLPEYAAFASTAQSKMRDRLREMQLQSKKARAKEAEAAAAEEKKRDEKKKADEKERDAAGTAMGDDDENESAKKRAKLDDGAAAASTGSTGAAASASADTEMADAADESAVAVGDEKEKKSKKAKKKEGTGESAGAHVHPLKETKEEKDAIEKAIKKAIRVPEVMAMPKGDAVKLPPMSDEEQTQENNTNMSTHTRRYDANTLISPCPGFSLPFCPFSPPESQQRFLADLSYRQKLSSSSLPSVCFYTFLNSLHTVNSISISTDATRVSCALSDSTIRLYDLRDPAIRQSTNPQPEDDLIEGKEAHAGDEHASAEGAGASTIGMTRVITGSNIINRRLGDEHSKLRQNTSPGEKDT